jgi:hypothetical protein
MSFTEFTISALLKGKPKSAGSMISIRRRMLLLFAVIVGSVILWPQPGAGQLERVYHPLYLPAGHNWVFRQLYPATDRLFNAFDYGHGILAETLYTRPHAPAEYLEQEIYLHLTRVILPNPPRLPLAEATFVPRFSRYVPVVQEMFEWAHVLHRQTYDILADRRVQDKEAALEALLNYYQRSGLAFTDAPKSMAIMDEQYYSKAFRERHPKFNGLIWAYHWLQIAIHEPLVLYDDPEQRQAAMNAVLARFWQMLEDPPERLPSEMPMMPSIAPAFSARFPRLAATFDNLHMMHDVVSDILISDRVEDRRAELYRAADAFRNPAILAVTDDEWRSMAVGHGVAQQGGAAVDFLPAVPTLEQPEHEPHKHGH